MWECIKGHGHAFNHNKQRNSNKVTAKVQETEKLYRGLQIGLSLISLLLFRA